MSMQTEITACVDCEGAGVLTCLEVMSCPLCRGTGKHFNVTCLGCGGTGKADFEDEEICPSCDGTGHNPPGFELRHSASRQSVR